MRVACDYDELTTIQVELGVETVLGEESDLGIWHGRLEPLAGQLRQTTGGHADLRLELDDERRTLEPNVTVELQCTLRGDPAGIPIDSRRLVSLCRPRSEPTDTRGRVDQPLLGETPGADRIDEGVSHSSDRLVEQVMAQAERVGTGERSLARRPPPLPRRR